MGLRTFPFRTPDSTLIYRIVENLVGKVGEFGKLSVIHQTKIMKTSNYK